VTIDLQPVTVPVSPAILALNNAHSVELAWLEAERFGSLVRQSFYARKIGVADAFLLAFDQTAPYDSPNYLCSERVTHDLYTSTASSSRQRCEAAAMRKSTLLSNSRTMSIPDLLCFAAPIARR
jgi:predicted GNAT superfamily acetyltransferase